MFLWHSSYILSDRLNKVRIKLKSTWLIISFPDYKMFSRRHLTQTIEQNWKLKAKDTEKRKAKTQKDENLVLPQE